MKFFPALILSSVFSLGFSVNSFASAQMIKAPDTTLLAAMRSELHRSMDSLKLRDQKGPYFLGYMLWDVQGFGVEASQGSIEKSGSQPLRMINVDLRVGSYDHDQSLYEGGVVFGPRLRAPVPYSNDTLLLRQAFWAETDARYKVALEQLAQKKSFVAEHHGVDALPDWSRQKILQQRSIDAIIPPDTSAWIALCRKLSASISANTWLAESRVAYQYYYITIYYVDSEGATYIQSTQENTLLAALLCQAQDGAPLWDYLRMSARDSLSGGGKSGSTSLSALNDSLSILTHRMDRLRQSPPMAFYRGPVLFTGNAAGEVIQHALLDPQARLREALSENSQPAFLLNMKGRKYLPSNFNVTDVPDQNRYQGKLLYGSYAFDHEGQPAEDVSLIEQGRIADFYSGKLPMKNQNDHDNGHWRYGEGFPGVVRVDATGGVSEKALVDSLRSLTRDEGATFGLVVSKFVDDDAFKLLRHPLTQSISFGGFAASRGSFSLSAPLTMDMVNANTGKKVPVRGLLFNALDSKSLRDISAVGNSPTLFEPQASFSMLCPSLLFNLLDLGGSRQTQQRLPILP